MIQVHFVVRGIPAPQGSKRHVGNGVMVESSKKVKPWRDAVRSEAVAAMAAAGVHRLDGLVALEVDFWFARPASHFGTGRNAGVLKASAPAAPGGPPDLSKLIRSTEDALTDAAVWADDARVVRVMASKRYCHPALMASPGATITVRPWPLDGAA